jgi:hypothetical protein
VEERAQSRVVGQTIRKVTENVVCHSSCPPRLPKLVIPKTDDSLAYCRMQTTAVGIANQNSIFANEFCVDLNASKKKVVCFLHKAYADKYFCSVDEGVWPVNFAVV